MTAGGPRAGAIVERAPAKINLYLHVVGRRADGYHLLDSLVAFAELGDELHVAPADDLTLEVSGPFAAALAGEGDNNLVLKAARTLRPLAGARGARIHLIKNLPVASGIGGGSADAAATLRALARLWGVTAPLDDIAARLGADVPVCLAGRPAFMSGVGETLEPAPELPRLGVVLVTPGVALPTAKVFAARSGDFSPVRSFQFGPDGLIEALRQRGNDLKQAAIGLVPQIAEILSALRTDGARISRMSGSGATCFGLFDDPLAADAAASRLKERRPGWWIAPTALRPR